MNGGQLIAQVLQNHGVQHLFTLCGGHIAPIYVEAEKNGILGHGLHHPFHTMFEDVFEELPWHLEEQAAQAIRERKIKWPD